MKYYKQDSIPLEKIKPGIGERAYDEFGNLIEIDAFGDPTLIKRTVLNDGEKVDSFIKENWLKAFWAMSKYILKGNDIQDSNNEETED